VTPDAIARKVNTLEGAPTTSRLTGSAVVDWRILLVAPGGPEAA
jgi:hypothetical protein